MNKSYRKREAELRREALKHNPRIDNPEAEAALQKRLSEMGLTRLVDPKPPQRATRDLKRLESDIRSVELQKVRTKSPF